MMYGPDFDADTKFYGK